MSENIHDEVLPAEDTAPESSPETKPEGDGKPEVKPTEKPNLPFNEDPKIMDFIDRQIAARETKLREEFDSKYAKPAAPRDESITVPKWFGGGAQTPEVIEMWKEYQAEQTKITAAAEEKAFQRLNSTQSAQTKAVEEANAWLNESVTAIEKEAGKTIDRNALLKITLDNELIDSKGRWNYKAAWQILKGQTAAPSDRQDRKKLAGDTMDDAGGDVGGNKNIKTSEDFKKERPW